VDRNIIIELIRIIPTLIWAAAIVAVVLVFRTTIRTRLLPRITELKAFGVEATFVKEQLDRAAETSPAGSESDRSQVAKRAERIASLLQDARLLLVNDIPREMFHVVRILEELNIRVDIVTSTAEALDALTKQPYDVVISDMRRDDVPDEGLRFLRESRVRGVYRPTILSVGRYDPNQGTPPYAFGITNRVDELLNLVFDVLERVRG
jgi:CheY-like chemotaxis protein